MDFMQRVMGQVGGGASLGVQKAAWDVHGAVPCFAEAFYFSAQASRAKGDPYTRVLPCGLAQIQAFR